MMHRGNKLNQGILVFILGLVLIVWQCYYVMDWRPALQLLSYPTLASHRANASDNAQVATANSSSLDSPKKYELTDVEHQNASYGDEEVPFKKILFWNEAYGTKNFIIGLGKNVFREAGCPVWQCESSDDRRNVLEYDAVVFHLRSWTRTDLPRSRTINQRYVFWSIESAGWRFVDTNPMANFFNWTMTYRLDSDVVNPYGRIEPLENGSVPLHPSPDEMEHYLSKPTSVNYATGKRKLAAWFVSNCNSQSNRNELVKNLKRFIDVDIYGDCGSMVCSRNQEDECRQMAATNYKFYLSLENSLCLDYITEKFFGMMKHPIVPIVVDLHGHHKNASPTHSFINAADFPSVKALADYLIMLDKNDTLYNQYFWWKNHFRVRNSDLDWKQGMCSLCAKLHDPSLPPKIYRDMTEWWDRQSSCKSIYF